MSPSSENLVNICGHHSELCASIHTKVTGSVGWIEVVYKNGWHLHVCFC